MFSGTCFYFNNILMQRLYSLYIYACLSSSMAPGLLILDDLVSLQLIMQNVNETANVNSIDIIYI